ncbi:MAG: beta-hydroxyacyl-ACP dehydratase [Planctomycetes bacterium]|nr:beta-hydroxyacyl-ACP dehydratase [Planctomycetota bacterium]
MGQPLVDLNALDLSRDVLPQEELRSLLPHRGTFQLLDGICHFDRERKLAVGYKDWTADAWWAKDHVPGKPIMPGVLMIEGAAQIATVLIKLTSEWEIDRFIGLAGLNEVRFRGMIVPPARMYFVSGDMKVSGRRLARMPAQAFCNGQMTLELELLGTML